MELATSSQNLKVVLLDVYGTLVNMSEVEKRVNSLMDNRRAYIKWFDLFMQYCFVDNCTNQFNDFSSIAKATLQMTAHLFGKAVRNQDLEGVLELFKHLPLLEGVQEGLSALRDSNFRISALTNSPEKIVIDRMERTGLISYFHEVLSAEHVKKYKPCVEVYQWAARKVDASPKDVLLVSAHGWDIMGASNVQMQTAYIEQDSQILYPLSPKPNFICRNLVQLAKLLKENSTVL